MADDDVLIGVLRTGEYGETRASMRPDRQGGYTFDLRLWHTKGNLAWPSKKGVSLPAYCLPALASAVATAMQLTAQHEDEDVDARRLASAGPVI